MLLSLKTAKPLLNSPFKFIHLASHNPLKTTKGNDFHNLNCNFFNLKHTHDFILCKKNWEFFQGIKKKSVFEENPGSEIEIGRDIWRAA
jgi:hypothetical protein